MTRADWKKQDSQRRLELHKVNGTPENLAWHLRNVESGGKLLEEIREAGRKINEMSWSILEEIHNSQAYKDGVAKIRAASEFLGDAFTPEEGEFVKEIN